MNNLELLFNKHRFHQNNSPENNVRDLYNLIIKYLNDKTIMIEIGSFAGVSTELFAMHVKHIYSIDPYIEYAEMGSAIKNAEKEFNKLLNQYSNITSIKQTSESVAKSNYFTDNSIDFIYIDGAHDYNNVINDINLWIPKIKTTGLIGGHDIYNNDVYRAVKDYGLDIIETFKEQSWVAYAHK